LQVHHKKYIDGLMPWEYDNDTLESLCSTCHKKEHNIKPKKKVAKKKKKVKKPISRIIRIRKID
jgi:5-methylcytosine-specific restriction endonuclease McrA